MKKTRFDIAKESPEAMARLICDHIEDFAGDDEFMCSKCPWEENCCEGHNGIAEWLKGTYDESTEEAFD